MFAELAIIDCIIGHIKIIKDSDDYIHIPPDFRNRSAYR